jgi:acyl transferase domain-containing protein
MGRELISTYPVFAQSMFRSERHFTTLGADWLLLAELNKSPAQSRIDEATISQPSCTAIQIALVDLFGSWNIRPHVVCGHSSGEIAAAYASGSVTAADALSIAFHRRTSVADLKTRAPNLEGGMLAAGLSAEQALGYISSGSYYSSQGVVVACINSPTSVTLSSSTLALAEIQERLRIDGVTSRMLRVDAPYHSPYMNLIQEKYLSLISSISARQPGCYTKMVSSVTGNEIQGRDLNAIY